MNMVQRNQILFILTGLNLSLKQAASGGLMETEAQEVVDEALDILKRPNVFKNRAADYALSRLYARFTRLIGLQGMKLSAEANQWWQAVKDFMENDIYGELSQVGGPHFII